MTEPGPIPIANLLAAAAEVLERAGELPPLSVVCAPAERVLAPVTITPASSRMSRADQARLVRAVAAAMGWPSRQLADVEGGFTTSGMLHGIGIEVMAAPLSYAEESQVRTGSVTTAAHADLLRALTDWSAALPEQTTALELGEDLEANTLAARLLLASDAAVAKVPGLIITDDRPVDWSGFRGSGVLPTGHGLTVSVGSY